MAVQINGSTGLSGVDGSAATPALQGSDTNTGISFGTDEVNINTGGTTRTKIDSSGRLLVGTTSTTKYASIVTQGGPGDATGESAIRLERGGTPGSNDNLCGFDFCAENDRGAYVYAQRDGGTWTTGSSLPTRLVVATAADGASSATERMRITRDGYVAVGKTTTAIATAGLSIGVNDVGAVSTGTIISTVDGQESMYINRLTNDGTLISFRQAGTQEGVITVSGSTVSLVGSHLSRWSQFPGDAERTEILRGSVLSNLDEMCEWGEEENEQLNRMKLSDVEGDKNVAGVFVSWDDDDDTYTNDFFCAMTGDFVIRIAQGVTVERGDLLMSAGDGTAKPQGDDIVRSKTIAKVTSTNVSCTYDDGSYCVPCVLMAC